MGINNRVLVGKRKNIHQNAALSQKLQQKLNSDFTYANCPVLLNEKGEGLYQFWGLTTHSGAPSYFMIESDSIIDTTRNTILMREFLLEIEIPEKRINKRLRSVEKSMNRASQYEYTDMF